MTDLAETRKQARDIRAVPFSWHRLWRKASKALLVILLVLVTVVFVLPYAWMFLSSFKTTGEIFRYAFPLSWRTFIPVEPTLENFNSIFTKWSFDRYLLNSLLVSTAQMLGMVIICSLAAFVFSRMYFRGRDLLFGVVMFVAFVPFEVIMVPLYMVIRTMGLTNSYTSLFLPWIANPFGIFLLRQAMLEIPRDLDEAAKVEGASYLQILWHVVLPVIRPSVVTLALMSFLWSWNAFLWPLIVMNDPQKQVIQVAIATFTLPQQLPAWGEIFAGATIATLPILILFIALQGYYIRGVVMTGMKG